MIELINLFTHQSPDRQIQRTEPINMEARERNIVEVATLVTTDRRRLLAAPKAGSAAYRLFEMLPMMPRFTVERARQHLDTSFPTANAAIRLLTELGIVTEMTGQRKNRSFGYQAYINLLSEE